MQKNLFYLLDIHVVYSSVILPVNHSFIQKFGGHSVLMLLCIQQVVVAAFSR